MKVLITGGARSGKSRLAESRIADLPGGPVYIATAEAGDAEMAERIARHRARRRGWETVEAPVDLVGALARHAGRPRLVDCLTLWLSNLMLAERDWEAAADALAAAVRADPGPLALVTNEVGLGIVPAHPLGRRFRDAAGLVNQRVAEAADEVVLVVAGQPLRIKPPL